MRVVQADIHSHTGLNSHHFPQLHVRSTQSPQVTPAMRALPPAALLQVFLKHAFFIAIPRRGGKLLEQVTKGHGAVVPLHYLICHIIHADLVPIGKRCKHLGQKLLEQMRPLRVLFRKLHQVLNRLVDFPALLAIAHGLSPCWSFFGWG